MFFAVAALAISLFSCVPLVSAYTWGQHVRVPQNQNVYVDFNRAYCVSSDWILSGYMSPYFHDVALVDVVGDVGIREYNDWQFSGYCELRLLRRIQVYTSSGLEAETDWLWINTGGAWATSTYYDGFRYHYDVPVWFEDGLYVAHGAGLNYGAPQLPVAFAERVWVVQYSYQILPMTWWGSYMWGDHTGSVMGYVIHDERSNPQNWILSPCCSPCNVQSIAWTETYGSATLSNPSNIIGQANGAYAQLTANSQGSLARVCGYLNGFAGGRVYLYMRSLASNSRVLVYVSENNINWHLVGDRYVSYSQSYSWVDFGMPPINTYRYVLIIAYNSGLSSSINVDAVRTGHPP